MSLISLRAICFLACGFYLFVLIHWIRETKRNRKIRSSTEAHQDHEPQGIHVIDSGGATRRRRHLAARSVRPTNVALRSHGSDLGCLECERNAYDTIARSWRVGWRL
jgi:hypothetical protein